MNSTEIWNIIDEIANNGSRLVKEQLLRVALNDELFQRVMRAAYDPFITYGVTTELVTNSDGEMDISDEIIWNVLDALSKREITGNAARDIVYQLMILSTPYTADILWRIFSHDMRAGFSANTLNKVLPKLIPVFEVMLSHKYEEKRIKHFPVWMEPKLDGLRTICLVQNGEAEFFSRAGNIFPALAPLKPHIEQWVRDIGVTSCAFEGEAISGEFAETSGAVRRKSQLATTTEYHIFDYFPLEVITEGTRSDSFSTRRSTLKQISSHIHDESPLRVVPGQIASSHEDIQQIYDEYRQTRLSDYLGYGNFGDKTLEGAIIKILDGLYEKKRSHAWMKMKAEETEDLRVVDMLEGEGKYADNLGKLIVDRPFKDGIVKVRVGGGFSDELRTRIWRGEEKAIGRLIEIEHQEETPDGSLRHPRFLRFRDDKDTGL